MTFPKREDFLAAFRDNRSLAVSLLAGQTVELFFDSEAELLEGLPALDAFFRLPVSDRPAITPHLHAYFRDFTDDVGFEWVAPGMEQLAPGSEDIWQFVDPVTLTVMRGWAPGDKTGQRDYVVIEANCGWEEEHGLLLSWLDGQQLVKVSDYDGHPTNGHAYDDVSRDAFIYTSSPNQQYWTRADAQ